MIINHTFKFVFFAEPHTASRACARMLSKIPGSLQLGHHHMTQEYADDKDLLPVPGYLGFSVIRDPRDVIATKIAHVIYNRNSAVVVNSPVPSDAEFITKYVDAACNREHFFYHNPDYKIRYESLSRRILQLLDRLGVDCIDLKLEQFGVTPEKRPWWEYFNRKQLAKMEANIPEIEQFKVIS